MPTPYVSKNTFSFLLNTPPCSVGPVIKAGVIYRNQSWIPEIELRSKSDWDLPKKEGKWEKRKKRIKGQERGKQETERALCEVRVLRMKKWAREWVTTLSPFFCLISNSTFQKKRGSDWHQAKVLTDLVVHAQMSCSFLQSRKGTVPP